MKYGLDSEWQMYGKIIRRMRYELIGEIVVLWSLFSWRLVLFVTHRLAAKSNHNRTIAIGYKKYTINEEVLLRYSKLDPKLADDRAQNRTASFERQAASVVVLTICLFACLYHLHGPSMTVYPLLSSSLLIKLLRNRKAKCFPWTSDMKYFAFKGYK